MTKPFFSFLNIFFLKSYFISLKEQYSLKFVLLVFSNYFGIKGVLRSLLITVDLPYFTQAKWDMRSLQTARAIISIPDTIKGFGGLLSDVLPIFGYRKTIYMSIYCFIGTISMIFLGFIPFNANNHSVYVPTIFFSIIGLQIAFNDLLCEGKYVELMKQNDKERGNIITFSYYCFTFAAIIPIAIVGTFSDHYSARYLFLIFSIFSIQHLFFLYFGCMIQDHVPKHISNRLDFEKIKHFSYYVIICIIIVACAIGSFIFNLLFSNIYQFIYIIAVSIILMISIYVFLPKTISKINIYMYLVPAFYINIVATLEFFYIGKDGCNPTGPQFSMTYFRTIVGLIALVAQLIAIFVFQKFFINYKIRFSYWFTTFLKCLASIFDLIMVKRLNIKIGIPDHFMYIFGNAMIYQCAFMLDLMPTAIMLAKICPKHIESTTFALLAGFANFGITVSGFLGIYLTDAFGIIASEDGPCNFDNLTYVIIIGHFILPLLTIPMTFFLIPNKYILDDFLNEEKKPEINVLANETKVL